jgi:hypothetical protein
MQFKKAERKKLKLRLALTGTSGSGKTLGALYIAKGLSGKIAVIDTEQDSSSLYTDKVEFDSLKLDAPYSPERYIEAIKMANKAGYEVLIIDSITHEWNGVGGILQLNDEVAKAKFKGNSWSAWSEMTPRHRKFIDAILQCDMHVIVTMRSKMETSQVKENGYTKVQKLGLKAEQKDDIEYEFTTVLDIAHDGHYALASKDRTGLFTDRDPRIINEKIGEELKEWLDLGIDIDKELKEKYILFNEQLNNINTLDELKVLAEIISLTSFKEPEKTLLRETYKAKKMALEQIVEEIVI